MFNNSICLFFTRESSLDLKENRINLYLCPKDIMIKIKKLFEFLEKTRSSCTDQPTYSQSSSADTTMHLLKVPIKQKC